MQKVALKVLQSKDDWVDKFTLSVSKAKTFDNCKAKYKFCYIDKLPRKDWDFHVFGKFLHSILEHFHKSVIETQSTAIESLLNDSWHHAVKEYDATLSLDQKKEAKGIMESYKRLLDDEGMPNVIAVEKSFYIAVDDVVLLNGFIDRVQIDKDNVLHVVDYKTTKDKKYLKDFFQLQTYAFALMTEDSSINRVRASFICLRHDFDVLTEEYTRADVEGIGEKFAKYASTIHEERLWRANPQFLCKYCDYQDKCNPGTEYLVKKGVIKSKPNKGFGFIKKWSTTPA